MTDEYNLENDILLKLQSVSVKEFKKDYCDYDERITDLEETNIEKRLLALEEAAATVDPLFKMIEFNFKDKIGVDLLVENEGATLIQRIGSLECDLESIHKSISKIEYCLNEPLKKGNQLFVQSKEKEKQPKKCPPCDGFGKRYVGIWGTFWDCKACEGKGIVWG